MKFSGHETFPIREGWLHKGLKLLLEHPDRLAGDDAADWLGVGRNMAKSIRHWLQVTGLAEKETSQATIRREMLAPTDLGHLIHERDPYFSEKGTWWALHVNLVGNAGQATTWAWFFNSSSANRFERALCVESLRRHLQLSKQKRIPSRRTLENDVACLLNSYARSIPAEHVDPEDAFDCPFSELSLMSYFRTSGYFQLHQGVKDVPGELLGYSLAKVFPDASGKQGQTDITIESATRTAGGPGRAFMLTSEAMFEQAVRAENELGSATIQIAGLAGKRVIRVASKSTLAWLTDYYDRQKQGNRNAA